jgi:hypothetical protein
MLSIPDLRQLELGDTIEAGTIFGGMSKEKLKLKIEHVQPDPLQMSGTGSYYGIHVGRFEVKVAEEVATWSWLSPTPVALIEAKPAEPDVKEDAA